MCHQNNSIPYFMKAKLEAVWHFSCLTYQRIINAALKI